MDASGPEPTVVTTPNHAESSAAVAVADKPLIRDRWQELRQLGQGGMSTVFAVHDLQTNEDLALKLIRPELVCDVRSAIRLRAEERALRELQSAPHMLQIHPSQPYADGALILTELIDGEDALKTLKKGMDLPLALRIAEDAAACLVFAHEHRFVHRDIKPANILIAPDGAKVIDWGVALSLDDGDLFPDAVVGTPSYMPPEQAMGEAEPMSDVYSLGCSLYEMLTGEDSAPPEARQSTFTMLTWRDKHDGPNPCTICPRIPKGLGALVEKTMRRGLNERVQSAAELLHGLEYYDVAPMQATRRTVVDLTPLQYTDVVSRN